MATLSELQQQHGAAPARPKASLPEILAMPQEKQFPEMLKAFKSHIAVALPAHLSPDRMARIALTAYRQNKTLSLCDPMSLFQAVILSSQLGLEIGVDGQAYLVPRKQKGKWVAVFVPGWKGYVELINRANKADIWTGAVFKGDAFEYELGDRPFVRHKPMGESDETKANLTHVYCIGRKHNSENPIIEVWPVGKVERHLKKYNNVGESHYALANDTNFIAYGRKVALLQVQKYLPKSVELRAVEAIDHHGSAAVDLKDVIDGSWENISATAEDAGGDDTTATSTDTGAVSSASPAEPAEQGHPGPAADASPAAASAAASVSTPSSNKRQRRVIE